jgi:hypothetical protein
MPQPYFVPVRPRFSRITQRRGVSGATSVSYLFPFTFNEIIKPSFGRPVDFYASIRDPQPGKIAEKRPV